MTRSFAVLLASVLVLANAARADVNISKKPTQNMDCVAGVCTATGKNAILNVSDLTTMLAAGDVTVKFGGGALAIQINDGFSWTSTSRLTLDANTSVSVHKPVVVAGTGALTVTTNDGGSGGDLKFFDQGKIDFWDLSSSLVINGNSFTLVGDIASLAGDITANQFGNFAFVKNYDASVDGVYKHAPIAVNFGGAFEGLGHVVDNLTVNGHGTYIGFFGATIYQSVVRDIALDHLVMTTNGNGQHYVGGLAAENGGTMIGVEVSGTVLDATGNFKSYIGGVVGYNAGTLLRASAEGSVSGANAGGLVGLSDGSITDAQADVVISSIYRAGGLVGSNGGSISLSRATGAVSLGFHRFPAGQPPDLANEIASLDGGVDISQITHDVVEQAFNGVEAGGLVGGSGGPIDQSYATGAVTGTSHCCGGYAGGLFGRNLGTVTNSYATGQVQSVAGSVMGGFSGLNYKGATVASSYSMGLVSDTGTGPQGNADLVGGFVGSDRRNVGLTTDYWDVDSSGQQSGCGNRCPGATGLSDTQLKSGLPNGFDPAIWGQSPSINNGYPYLLANPPQ